MMSSQLVPTHTLYFTVRTFSSSLDRPFPSCIHHLEYAHPLHLLAPIHFPQFLEVSLPQPDAPPLPGALKFLYYSTRDGVLRKALGFVCFPVNYTFYEGQERVLFCSWFYP